MPLEDIQRVSCDAHKCSKKKVEGAIEDFELKIYEWGWRNVVVYDHEGHEEDFTICPHHAKQINSVLYGPQKKGD